MPQKKAVGHPAKQDPEVAKLFRTMKASVELVRDLQDKLPPETFYYFRCGVLAQMEAYSHLTGKPSAFGLIAEGKDVIF